MMHQRRKLCNIIDISLAFTGTSMDDKLSTDCSIPSLDIDSTCSDTSSACDSASVGEPLPEREEKPRSIFGDYWSKNGITMSPESQKYLQRTKLSMETSDSLVSALTASTSRNAKDPEKSNLVDSPRRKIFGRANVHSFDDALLRQVSLPDFNTITPKLRSSSVSSLPETSSKPVKTCLRAGRFSGNRQRSQSLVSFSPKVDIIVYQKPVELWSSEKWSSYFS